MTHENSGRVRVAATLFFLACAGNAAAADWFGLYAGGSIAQGQVGQVRFDQLPENFIFGWPAGVPFTVGGFDHELSFKAMLGIRPIPYLGAEVAYVDFGHIAHGYEYDGLRMKVRGSAATAVGYLPLPWNVDLFGKAGIGRLEAVYRAWSKCPPYYACIGPDVDYRLARTDVGFVGGIGAQLHLGKAAVRAEYERFTIAGGHPRLLSIGVTYAPAATDTPSPFWMRSPGSGWYVGAGTGLAEYKLGGYTATYPLISDSLRDFSYHALLGYRFNRYVALEGGYEYLGQANDELGNIFRPYEANYHEVFRANAYKLDARATLPITASFGAFALLGASTLQVKQVFYQPPYVFSHPIRDDATHAFYGVGLQYRLTNHLGLRLQWEKFSGFRAVDSVRNYSLGLEADL